MDREAWQAIVHGLPRVGHNLVTKPAPPVQEIWVQSLGWEDHMEEGMATHSSVLAWRISWTEEAGRLQSIWSQRVGYN